MAEEENGVRPIRLMSFVSEDQLEESKKNRGERVEDGTAQRDKPLFEILKENKDKKDAEFNERFKHRPPKALDEDETEFLDNLEMSRKEYERQVADEEAQQLRSFQKAVAAQSSTVHELNDTPSVPKLEEVKPLARKNPPAGPLGGLLIKVKPQAKKSKVDNGISERSSAPTKPSNDDIVKSSAVDKGALVGLVSYGDESEEEDDR
ncbi:Nefa-interacting nuclear protein [Thalictrum thalictroides]|uniref:Nefa-interacting nuclear protein n=1 Tax=Thalictrum thalictroides TaxID=46969 RepID=A0A7J6V0B5_THATH|nr:Nefa-interacting nuclear protein [Thalictrum thalictroides]